MSLSCAVLSWLMTEVRLRRNLLLGVGELLDLVHDFDAEELDLDRPQAVKELVEVGLGIGQGLVGIRLFPGGIGLSVSDWVWSGGRSRVGRSDCAGPCV
jgi:hypothetical protein